MSNEVGITKKGLPNRRHQAKAKTRKKVINAGRALFMEGGYSQATIRDIAKRAGMSTGAVFASFRDKADLLLTIVEDETKSHEKMLVRAATEEGTVLDRIVRVCATDFSFFNERFHLLEATASLEVRRHTGQWSGIPDRARIPLYIRRRSVTDVIASVLTGNQGDEKTDKETEAKARMLSDTHLYACRVEVLRSMPLEMYQSRLKELFELIISSGEQS